MQQSNSLITVRMGHVCISFSCHITEKSVFVSLCSGLVWTSILTFYTRLMQIIIMCKICRLFPPYIANSGKCCHNIQDQNDTFTHVLFVCPANGANLKMYLNNCRKII